MTVLKRDVTEMDLFTLQEYAKGLQEALLPFAHAAARIAHYGGVAEDAPLYAISDRSNVLTELLFNDTDVMDFEDIVQGEDCRSVTVQDLDVAVLALHGKDS